MKQHEGIMIMVAAKPITWVCVALLPLAAACAPHEYAIRDVARASVTSVSAIGEGGYYKVGKPYQIAGLWYYPKEDFALVETGIASWYGDEFHGKPTANGEVFDRDAVTAAHPTLQMPSLVRVTNLENGRSLAVRINDRGPFARSRIIDVSRRTAELLDFRDQGTAKVRVEVLPEESQRLAALARDGASVAQQEAFIARRHDSARTMPAVQTALAPVRPTSVFVQAGAFSVADNAYRLQAQLNPYGQTQVDPISVHGRQLFRVRVGPLQAVEQADTLLAMLTEIGHPLATVVVE